MTTIRYVASTGSDSNPGTKDAPWKSLQRIRTALDTGELGRGDGVFLNRGDTFYGSIEIPLLKGTKGNLVFGAYGTGMAPKISGYKVSNNAWVQHSTGIWRLNLLAGSGQYTGNTGSGATNVGFLKVNGTIKGWKKWTLAACTSQWDFYSDATNVYVRLDSNPGAGVEIAVRQNAFRVSPNNRVSGLHLIGHGAHGFVNYSAHDIHITDNIIEEIGGSALSEGTRYGNGVEIWIGARDVLVEGNIIRQTYDVGVTMQGPIEGTNKSWRNIHIRRNRIENCNQTFEVWSQGVPGADTGHIGCSFTDNYCADAGMSWAADIRPDRDGRGTHILTYDIQLPCDITIARNVFYRAKHCYAYCTYNNQFPPGLRAYNNSIHLNPGQKIVWQNSETIEQFEAYRSRTGKEVGSTFHFPPSESAAAVNGLKALTSPDNSDTTFDLIESLALGGGDIAPDGSLFINGSSNGATYTRFGTITVQGQHGTVDALIAFQNGKDADGTRSFGLLDVRVSGIGSSGGGSSKVQLSILGTPYTYASTGLFSLSDFIAVKVANDVTNHVYKVELWLKATDVYAGMTFRTLILQSSAGATFELGTVTQATTLPAGTQVLPEMNRTPYVHRPQPISGAPTTVPAYVGQEVVDTVARRVYKATGTASAADWTAMN